jgi:hypothetical protein
MFLTDLRLIECEAELVPNAGRKALQPNERVDKPNQLARLFGLVGHSGVDGVYRAGGVPAGLPQSPGACRDARMKDLRK